MATILEIDISGADTPGAYKAKVLESPAGEASATFQLDPSTLIDRLAGLQQTLLVSSVPSRKMVSRGEADVQQVGSLLFESLFSSPEMEGVYRASSAVASDRGDALRLVLRISTAELAALPWESMFDQAFSNYVSRREPLVRYLSVPSAPPPLKVELPLRILAIIASPRGLPMLDVGKEQEDLAKALAEPIQRGSIVLNWLEHATWPALQDALLADSWHIIHFIGHGDFNVERDEGVLALESERGHIHQVSASSFVDLLREAQPMPRLVVLNACESSAASGTDMFGGTAAALVRGGVSAVTAMQFEISDAAAIAFCRGFYTAIGRGRGIDEAVRSGRVAILGIGDGSLEWITPTLHLRGRETRLFSVSRSLRSAATQQSSDEQRSNALAASESGDVASAVPLLDNLLAENPDDSEVRQARQRAVAEANSPTTVGEVLPGSQPDSGPDVDSYYPDRFAELWTLAKRVKRSDRPSKDELRPLATALSPREKIVGIIRIQITWTKFMAVIFTDQYVHFSASDTLAPEITSPYGHGESGRASIPLPDITNIVEAGGDVIVNVEARGSLLLTDFWTAGADVGKMQAHLAEAREIAAARD